MSSTITKTLTASQQNGSAETVKLSSSEAPSLPAPAKLRIEPPKCHAVCLLNLDVKVLTQPLGAENQWSERGDGRVSFNGFTIRVSAHTRKLGLTPSTGGSPSGKINCDFEGGSDDSPAGNLLDDKKGSDGDLLKQDITSSNVSANTVDDEAFEDTIILEDTITSDTPFVGENCCIVWNSFEQQLSLCLMYASEEGYAASWSALVALQDKAYPPFRFDLLERCRTASSLTASPARQRLQTGSDIDQFMSVSPHASPCDSNVPAGILPYSYFIHNQYSPPLGFIEHHAVALSIMEHGHALNPVLYKEKAVAVELITIATADLVEHLLSDDVFALVAGGLTSDAETPSYTVPDELVKLNATDQLTTLINKDLRLSMLQEQLLPSTTDTSVFVKLVTVSHHIRNEITCLLLSGEAMLAQARQALLIAPTLTPSAAVRNRAQSMDPASSMASCSSEPRCSSVASVGPPTPHPPSLSVTESNAKAEAQVVAHLRFFRCVATLCIAEFGRDFVGPVVVKIFQGGLLEVLSLVAERYAMISGAGSPFVSGLESSKGAERVKLGNGQQRRSAASTGGGDVGPGTAATVMAASPAPTAHYYSAAVERELAWLLDATLVRLNERQEEQFMNELVRIPILEDPLKYNGIMTFLVRQLVLHGPGVSPRRSLRDHIGTRNPLLLFHVLGLHDDEGSAAAERVQDVEHTNIRNRFHHHVITKYIAPASRGVIAVPPPPTSVSKSVPIVQFNSTNSLLCSLPQGISPAFIRVLDYLVTIASPENREVLLKCILHHHSYVLQFIEGCCEIAVTHGRLVGSDVLAGNMRFLKTLLQQLNTAPCDTQESPLAIFAAPPEPVPQSLITTMCRQLTVERDSFHPILKAYNTLGGARRNSVFHSAVYALLEVLEHCYPVGGSPATVAAKEEDSFLHLTAGTGAGASGRNTLRDVRDYVFFKHASLLPERSVRRFRESLLAEVSHRLGLEDHATMCDSMSAVSTSGSEMLRSSGKLRFVDEVEAVIGTANGSVSPGGSANVSATVVANVTNSEALFNPKKRPGSTQPTGSPNWGNISPVSPGIPLMLGLDSPESAERIIVSNNEAEDKEVVRIDAEGMETAESDVAEKEAGAPHEAIPAGEPLTHEAAVTESGISATSTDSEVTTSPAFVEEVIGIEEDEEVEMKKCSPHVGAPLQPTAPKNEKPATRPRSVGGHDGAVAATKSTPPVESVVNHSDGISLPSPSGKLSQMSTLPAASAGVTPSSGSGGASKKPLLNGATSDRSGGCVASSTEGVVLPKIHNRTSIAEKPK